MPGESKTMNEQLLLQKIFA